MYCTVVEVCPYIVPELGTGVKAKPTGEYVSNPETGDQRK
jgi:hypothetical protein